MNTSLKYIVFYFFPLVALLHRSQRASDDAAMHAFLDAMKRRDRIFTLHAIKPLFPHCQIYICVVKLGKCPMRAIIVAMDLARVVTRQCERIIEIYSVLFFPSVALLHRSTHHSLCERTLILNLHSALNVSKMVYIISGSSILIRQHYAHIYNFDVRFEDFCLVFLIFLKTGWENLK